MMSSPPDAATVAGWKEEFNRLLDDDTKSAKTHQQKLRLKALAVGGSHAFDRMLGMARKPILKLSMTSLGLRPASVREPRLDGERLPSGLDPVRPRRDQRSAQQDWDIAAAIVSIRRGYDREPGFEVRLRQRTGKTIRQLRKLVDHMDQGQGRYDTIKVNIRDIEARLAQGETWMFDDLRK